MDDRRARFLAQLRETFRVEAEEHIAAIAAGLVALETASPDNRDGLLETVFREAHSLKGAARAVDLRSAEALCAELEGMFSAAQRARQAPGAQQLDRAHATLRTLAILCADPSSGAGADSAATDIPAVTAATVVPPPPAEAPAAPGAADQGGSATAHPIASAAPIPGQAPRPLRGLPGHATPRPLTGAETVRVTVTKLTGLMRDAEQLVGSKNSAASLAQELRELAARMTAQDDPQGLADHAQAIRNLATFAARDAQSLAATSDRVLAATRGVLLLPCSSLLTTFPPSVRDMARQHGKDVDVRILGEDIEVDRRVLEELKDPLLHILRNAVDHGIETPAVRRDVGKPERASITITVAAAQHGRVELAIADDGAGIDRGRVLQAAREMGIAGVEPADGGSAHDPSSLIFESGLSSRTTVTDLSGRGLGLAIVREKVHKLNGTIAVESAPGQGTTFRIEIPLSLANFRGVLVGVAGRPVIIPSAAIARVLLIPAEQITTIDGRPSVSINGAPTALVRLRDLLELRGAVSGPAPAPAHASTLRSLVVLAVDGRRVALLVDSVQDEQEVILKHLGPLLVRVPAVAGVSIGAGGEIVPVLDPADLAGLALGHLAGEPGTPAQEPTAIPATARRLLVADDSITSRSLLRSLLAGEGYDVTTAVDGEEALSRLHTEAFDLVVSDVDMPRMNGLQLTSAIRADEHLGSLPVVLVTSLATPEDRSRGLEAGASAYVVKSNFDSGSLLDIVRRFL